MRSIKEGLSDLENCFWGIKGMCDGNNCRYWDEGKNQVGNYINYHCDYQVTLAEGEILEKKISEIDIPDVRKIKVNEVEVSVYVYFCYSCKRRMRIVGYDYNDEELCEQLVKTFDFFKKQSDSYYNYYNYCKCGAKQGYSHVMYYIKRFPYSYVKKFEEIAHRQIHNKKVALDANYWDKQRRIKLKDENYTCQRCSSKHRPQVHHIIPRRLFELEEYELAHALENLMVVCPRCHSKEEKKSNRYFKEEKSVLLEELYKFKLF